MLTLAEVAWRGFQARREGRVVDGLHRPALGVTHWSPVIDLFFRVAYRCAYRLMRVYWRLAHPQTHGALVAVWHEGMALLVRNSYVPYHSLPGGYVRRHETAREAALRELFEETGIRADASALKLAVDERHEWEGKRERIEIFEIDVAERPTVKVDNREVVQAAFFDPEEALALDLFPPIRQVMQRRLLPGDAGSPAQGAASRGDGGGKAAAQKALARKAPRR